MESFPDSSLHLLVRVKNDVPKDEETQAYYSLLLSEALDKNVIDLASDSILRPAIDYYIRKGSQAEKAKMFYYWGRIFENAQDTKSAIEKYIIASKFADDKNHHLRGLIFSSIGYLYVDQLSYSDALDMFSKASNEFRLSNNIKNLGYTLSREGWALFMLQDNENALVKCKESLIIAKQLKDTAQILVLSKYISGILSYRFNDTRSANIFLKQIYDEYTNGIIPKEDYTMWSYIHLKSKDYESAEHYISQVTRLDDNPYALAGHFDLKSIIQEKKGNYNTALAFARKSQKLQDSIYKSEKSVLIQDLDRKYKTQLLQDTLNLLKVQRRYLLFIIVLIGIIVITSIVIITKKIMRDKKEKEREIEEYRIFINQIQEDYEENQEKYKTLFEHYNKQDQKLQNFHDALEDRLASIKSLIEMASSSGENVDLFLKKFKNYIRIESGKNEKLFTNVQELVNLYYNGIVDHLKREYPKLSHDDLNFCCLIYLNIPISGIQLMYNYINMDSLYNRRYKIRQKMNLPSNVNLDHFLNELLNELSTST